MGDASREGEKQVDALPKEVIAVSMEGGDFLLLRLLLRMGLASRLVSRAGKTVSGELDAGSSEGEVGVLFSPSVVATESLRMLLFGLIPMPLTWCFCLNFSSQPGLLMGFKVAVSGPGIEAK